MLGRLHPTARDVSIIGAGYAGLLAAYQLLQQGYSVTVYEQSAHIGGLLATTQTPYGMVERAGHSVRTNAAFVDLCRQLNVPLVYSKAKNKYIWRNDKLHRWPLGLGETLHFALRAGTTRATNSQRTLADWGRDHLGQAAVDHILTPMAAGIYGSDPAHLQTNLALPRLAIPAGKTLLQHALNGFGLPKTDHQSRMAAPARGMQHLIDALAHHIATHPLGKLKPNTPVTALPDTSNVLIATNAAGAAALLANDSTLASALQNITYVPLVTATVFVRHGQHSAPQGVGALYSGTAPLHGLGTLFNSSTFDGRSTNGVDSFTVMLGGRKDLQLIDANDSTLRDMIINDLRQLIDLTADPLHMVITRWPNAIPEYDAQLATLLAGDFDWLRQPGHMLLGNYTGQVSLRGMAADTPAV